MLDLDAATRGRLVDLRRLLREGQARAQDRTRAGQLVAIVLLDAACEHVVSLARAHIGLGRVSSIEKALNELQDANEGQWMPTGRKGVIELRHQRNGAMHHGVAPDADDVARWSQDVEAFVGSVVVHVFGTELSAVAVADSVQHPDVRRLLYRAERALDASDFAEAKYSAVDAFDVARRLWKGQRPRPGVPWYDRRESNMPEGVIVDLERLRDQAEIQPFATDFGEYLWLVDQHRRYGRRAPVPIEDALRALSFVTEWILRWEAHVARRVDREEEWLAQQQPPVSGEPDALPSLLDIHVAPDAGAEHVDPPMVRVTAQLQDIPVEERQQWCFLAGDSLSGRLAGFGTRGAVCDRAGRLSFEIPADASHVELLVARIVEATADATERWRAYCENERAAALQATDRLEACRQALEPWLRPDGRLRQVEFLPGRRDAVRVHFARRLEVHEAYWALELLQKCYGDHPGAHRIELGDDWADVPFPQHDDDAGTIVARVLRALDESDDVRGGTRVMLERFAASLQATMRAELALARADR